MDTKKYNLYPTHYYVDYTPYLVKSPDHSVLEMEELLVVDFLILDKLKKNRNKFLFAKKNK
jgi:hypothetical protein